MASEKHISEGSKFVFGSGDGQVNFPGGFYLISSSHPVWTGLSGNLIVEGLKLAQYQLSWVLATRT